MKWLFFLPASDSPWSMLFRTNLYIALFLQPLNAQDASFPPLSLVYVPSHLHSLLDMSLL